ncbi:hypothetical protein MUP51_01315 [Candidatus Bathyarchaeota archaeon]|nr:hypothetical protein [Candidatus Bathyarchaeota archaeon]
MVSWTIVSEQICELIKDEAGISVDPNELEFIVGDELHIRLFDEEFTSIDADYVDESDDEDLAYIIVESIDRLAKRVTENRFRYLRGIIEPIIRGIEKEEAIIISFEVEDRGYLDRGRHYLNEREYELDYPDIVLRVETAHEVLEIAVDPYQIDEPFDKAELIKKMKH